MARCSEKKKAQSQLQIGFTLDQIEKLHIHDVCRYVVCSLHIINLDPKKIRNAPQRHTILLDYKRPTTLFEDSSDCVFHSIFFWFWFLYFSVAVSFCVSVSFVQWTKEHLNTKYSTQNNNLSTLFTSQTHSSTKSAKYSVLILNI